LTKGDEYILNFFQNLCGLLKDYENHVNTIASSLQHITMRINALINPTPENKLKVVGLPPSNKLSIRIGNHSKKLRKLRENILQKIEKLKDILNDSKVPCPRCEGKGRIQKRKLVRWEKFADYIREYEPCPTCNGSGYFPISEKIKQIGIDVINNIKKSEQIEIIEINKLREQVKSLEKENTELKRKLELFIVEVHGSLPPLKWGSWYESITFTANNIDYTVKVRDNKYSIKLKNNEKYVVKVTLKRLFGPRRTEIKTLGELVLFAKEQNVEKNWI